MPPSPIKLPRFGRRDDGSKIMPKPSESEASSSPPPNASTDTITESTTSTETGTISPSPSREDDQFDEIEERLWKEDEEEEHFEENATAPRPPILRLPDGSLLSARDLLVEVAGESTRHLVTKPKTAEEEEEDIAPALSLDSHYSQPLSAESLRPILGPKWTSKSPHPGLIYHAHLLPDDTPQDSPLLKPRRPTLSVRHTDFLSSLTHLPDHNRYVFSGTLNGWPGLGPHLPLELLSITYRKKHKRIPVGKPSVRRWWSSDTKTNKQHPPSVPPPHLLCETKSVRATLRTPPWAGVGWIKDNPGFAWHFDGADRLRCGKEMIESSLKDLEHEAVTAHMFQHRYALPKGKLESPKDLLTYHAAVLMEWKDQPYVTVVELALLNGIGGYRGRSNWYHDKDDTRKGSSLYRSLEPEMILPWRSDRSEIRIMDLPHCPTKTTFLRYMKDYTGAGKRFLDPQIVKSHPIRLIHRKKRDILSYLANNIRREGRYTEIEQLRNCQTFAADLYGFLVGKKGIEPIGTANRILPGYVPRTYLFLYDADMYENDD